MATTIPLLAVILEPSSSVTSGGDSVSELVTSITLAPATHLQPLTLGPIWQDAVLLTFAGNLEVVFAARLGCRSWICSHCTSLKNVAESIA